MIVLTKPQEQSSPLRRVLGLGKNSHVETLDSALSPLSSSSFILLGSCSRMALKGAARLVVCLTLEPYAD